MVRGVLFKTLPTWGFNWWRLFVLRSFGAEIGVGCKISPTCRIWAPWNLKIGNYVCLAEGVDFYNVGKISIGSYSTISQRAFLCAASHDISKLEKPLVVGAIEIKEYAWVCAEAFVGKGVVIGKGAVVGARAVAISKVGDWDVVAGNPAVLVKKRVVNSSG
jgi:putative colanic acid biosynthesis acetyltransferase WcaF